MRQRAPSLAWALALVPGLLVGGNAAAERSPGSPVTIRSCDRTLGVQAPPKRALSYGSTLTEMMLVLGLEDRMAGFASVRPGVRPAIQARYPGFSRLAALGEMGMPLEIVLENDVDFLFAGWHYGLRPGGEMTPERLGKLGVPVYELTESCAHIGKGVPPSLDYLFADLTNLAAIFGVPERADALIAGYRQRLEAVRQQVGDRPRPSVFLYSGGDRQAMSAGGLSMPQAIIAAAGGTNMAADFPVSWFHVSWETVIDRNPHLIIMLEATGTSLDQRLSLLAARPGLDRIDAIRNRRVVTLQYEELTPGPMNIGAVEKLARALHPEAFAEPDPGTGSRP